MENNLQEIKATAENALNEINQKTLHVSRVNGAVEIDSALKVLVDIISHIFSELESKEEPKAEET